MNHSWFTSIDKLMHWNAGVWTKNNAKASQFILRIHYDQLFIAADSQILETLNMRNKLKGIYKDDILILLFSDNGHNVRKLKFQIKQNAAHYLKKLGELFPVISHVSNQPSNTLPSKYRNIEEIFRSILERNDHDKSQAQNLVMDLSSSHCKSFIRMCLLDPQFPQIVAQIEKVLTEEVLK